MRILWALAMKTLVLCCKNYFTDKSRYITHYSDMNQSVKLSFRIVLLLALLAMAKPAAARIIYVDPATGQNTNGFADGWGLSWAKPCKDLMHAIYWSAQGDEIWLNEGTYYPCQPQNGLGTPNADRSLSFYPKKNTQIYGGFSKTAGATDMGSRNPAIYVSKLSGEIQQDNNITNNSRRIMSTYLLEGFSVLDGVTITGAYTEEGSTGSAYANFGGGLFLNNVSPAINNCTFLSNTATQGGGVFCENSSPSFNNCKFLGNWVQYAPTFIVVYPSHGGAVYNKFGTPVYNNCLFDNNVSKWSNQSDVSGTGFAVYNEKSNAQFTNCQFTNNFSIGYSSVRRPAAVLNVGGAPAYIGCLFQANGGRGMSSVEGCEDQVRACIFTGNSGGLQIDQSGTRVYNCQFSGNGLPKEGVGGAISISDTKERVPVVSNCLINNNVSERGAGIYAYYTSAKINNCTITGNQAGAQGGGGVYNIGRGYKLALPPVGNIFPSSMVSTPLEYSNCIVYGNNGGNNTPFDSLTKNFFSDVTPVFVYAYPFGTNVNTTDYRPDVRNSIIGTTNNTEFGTKMAFDKGANYLNANPKFVAPASGNYTVTICSPAINTGNNTYVPPNSPTANLDLNNQDRFYEGITDIGCYELQQPFGGTITNTTQYICQGQTATIFGQPQTIGGVYTNSAPLPNGCTATTQITLVLRPLPKGVVTLSDNCFSTGTINIKPTVGTAPFTIKLNNITRNNISADSSAMFPGLTAGTYKYYITDANGCSDSANAVLSTNTFPSSVIYVDSAAVGSNTGTNWANAFTSLQSALSRANCAGITQIWVAKGTYYPSTNVAGVAVSNPSACFRMLNGIVIYGGFDRATGDTTLATRNWKKNPAILSGDIQQDGVVANNVYNVVNNYGNGLNNTAVLDGFTITGAYNTYDFGSGITYGGGMTNNGSSPTIRNCTFENNRVNGTAQSFGGAIYNLNCAPVISNCRFINNVVAASFYAFGGAIYNDVSSPSITNCAFIGNQSLNATYAYGAAIANATGAPITISNCLFTANSGGAIYSFNNNLILKNSTIYSNTAPVGIGGGLHNYGGGNPTVANCIIVGNSNGNITNASGTVTINHSDIATSGGSSAWNPALGVDAGGNIDVNPQFTADLHLSPCSPAKDAGSNAGYRDLIWTIIPELWVLPLIWAVMNTKPRFPIMAVLFM
jgi:Right handed beta helix region